MARLNIESIFVGLRRAWHPPSSAVEASFTQLSGVLSRLFERLRSDPDLAFLDRELYKDLGDTLDRLAGAPAETRPPTAAEFRKGFYFCNSLIQFMEDVYHDLHLEGEYRHPDNRGWMNLFQHWTTSDTFRMTWAVSASTYGLRFQEFCRRHLRLELGTAALVAVYEQAAGARRVPAILDRLESDFLQRMRRSHLKGQPNPLAARAAAVYAGRLVVPTARAAERAVFDQAPADLEEAGRDLLAFTFGFAVLDPAGNLMFIRVRRHLRNLGLGRLLMRLLVARLGLRDCELPEPPELALLGLRGVATDRIENLFKSVVNEAALERSKPDAGRDGPTGGPGDGPYTGAVRPPRVTWGHALGLLYWLLAWEGDRSLTTGELAEVSRALTRWLGPEFEVEDVLSVAQESLDWYLDARPSTQVLERECEWILGTLRREEWFDDAVRARIHEDLANIALADGQVTGAEATLGRNILRELGAGGDAGDGEAP